MSSIEFIRGENGKPGATSVLIETLGTVGAVSGTCFFGFPLIATPEGRLFIDATLVSSEKGIVLFDLVEQDDLGEFESRQDDLANKVEAKLKVHKELVEGRRLVPPLWVVTFAPRLQSAHTHTTSDYPVANEATLAHVLSQCEWQNCDDTIYKSTLSAIESLSSLRKSRLKRQVRRSDSRGAKLKRLEDSIATLDHRQNRAVIETVDGVQRIRGLAGSGKTIVLALKAAYLHTQHPEWHIAVTFNTRSLKGQFKRLITNFCIEQTGEEPDWTRLRVLNAWGAPGGEEREGIYYRFCRATGVEYLDFRSARRKFGGSSQPFDLVCREALSKAREMPELFDAILVDEAQDFGPGFLRLCYNTLPEPKRLVYAYDELQNLSGVSVLPPEDLFGEDSSGRPLVTLQGNERHDVILQVCYRNSRPVLATAHSLGFGIYRNAPDGSNGQLVQMFEYPALWEEIGYRVREGSLQKGRRVVLHRTETTSPRFLEEHSPVDDLVMFRRFEDQHTHNSWVVNQIRANIEEEELRHDDIVVIHPNPRTARRVLGPIREKLFAMGIQSHLAGVDTDADVFFRTDTASVVFTSIYRAKGNEAGMVYVINAQTCDCDGPGLASLRNRLFTAITRSKAWVRVVGYGERMDRLVQEFRQLATNDFCLEFEYPTDEVLTRMRTVHRDLSAADIRRLEGKKKQLRDIVKALETGELHPEDLDVETLTKLRRFLGGA